MKNHEVELRAFITQEQKEGLLAVLDGADMKKKYLKDIYYCPNSVKEFSEVEMDEVGSFSLRLRESEANGKVDTTINMKVITSYGDHNAWDEHEIKIDSFDDAERIFKALGFKAFFTLEKDRQIFDYDGMSVNLEEINGAGSAVEVEILTEKSESDTAKEKILKFLEKSGIDSDQIVKKSLTNVLMRKMAKF